MLLPRVMRQQQHGMLLPQQVHHCSLRDHLQGMSTLQLLQVAACVCLNVKVAECLPHMGFQPGAVQAQTLEVEEWGQLMAARL